MSSRRFELILKFIHLNDSEQQPKPDQSGYDKLYKVRLLLDIILKNFKDCYTRTQNLSVDESMISFKGHLSFIQYMPKKPHKWGMKAWILADALNGYTWGWKLYTGKEEGMVNKPSLSHRVVLELVDDACLQRKGFCVYMDTFYTSHALFKDLESHGIGACGTVRLNRKGISEAFRSTQVARRETFTTQDDTVLALKWKDKRDVKEYSMHMGGMDKSEYQVHVHMKHSIKCNQYNYMWWTMELIIIAKYTTICVIIYFALASGIQITIRTLLSPLKTLSFWVFNVNATYTPYFITGDQLVLYYGYAHRSMKWWIRIFFHLIDLALVNAHILNNATSEHKLTQLEFRLAVARGLLDGYDRTVRRRLSGRP